MQFKIPFELGNFEKLKKQSAFFISKIKHKKKSNFKKILKATDVPLTREEYLGICLKGFIVRFFTFSIFFTLIFFFLRISIPYIWGILCSSGACFFIFINQMAYPKLYTSRKQKEIERNLLPALEDILIQLNSGIPLFNILVNISVSDYEALSSEFKKAVGKINAGEPEAEVIEKLGENNASIFFRRTLWQISNGMKSGSDMAIVIKDSIKALSQEQMIQVQNYGSSLNPLIVMYMLISVIIPALSVTFLTILSSMLGLDENLSIMLFIGIFVFNILFQIMFLGMIKSRRPSLF
jgi:pilus assembly protein TadC